MSHRHLATARIWCLLGAGLALLSLTGRTTRAASTGSTLPGLAAYLPLAAHNLIPTDPYLLTILDRAGQEHDWSWLIEQFGAVTLERGSGSTVVGVLREVEGPATLIVHVSRGGQGVVGYPVMFYWPDAPWLDPALRACGKDRAVVGYTKENGNAEFGMGFGSYYFPPNGGPHMVWAGGPGSDCLGGLGMLGGTEHIHLDSVFYLSGTAGDPSMPGAPPPDWSVEPEDAQ